MRRYLPSTIHRYLHLPSPQRTHNHNTYRHNTTPPSQTLGQANNPLPPTSQSPPQPKHRHTSHTTTSQTDQTRPHNYSHNTRTQTRQYKSDKSNHTAGQHKRNQKQTRGAQSTYSRHTCRCHHNTGHQAHP